MTPTGIRDAFRQGMLNNPQQGYQQLGPISNPGLVLSRYLIDQRAGQTNQENQDQNKTGTKYLLDKVSTVSAPAGYGLAYERWKSSFLGREDSRLDLFEARGRVAVGVGEESVLETSLALMQPWGVPYIPGSAIKGLAASYLRNIASGDNPDLQPPVPEVDDNGKPVLDTRGKPIVHANAYSVLFGTGQDAGYVTWHDAWWFDDGSLPFRLDVITTHHPGYYQNTPGNHGPTDFDDPTPIPFLSTTGKFLFALQGPTEWTDFAFDLLTHALADVGIGAKTNAGYGRMANPRTLYRWEPPVDMMQELRDSIRDTPNDQINLRVHTWVTTWEHDVPETDKVGVAKEIIAKVRLHSKTFRRKFEDPNEYGHKLLLYVEANGGDQ